jgi:hypothetical protein
MYIQILLQPYWPPYLPLQDEQHRLAPVLPTTLHNLHVYSTALEEFGLNGLYLRTLISMMPAFRWTRALCLT